MKQQIFLAILVVIGSAAPAFGKHALLVGVSRYDHPRLNSTPLKFPEKDATAISDILEASGYDVQLLLGKDATKEAILQALTATARKTTQDDVLVIGFFGHGVQYANAAFFCPYDTELQTAADADGNALRDNGALRLEPSPASMVSMLEMLNAMSVAKANGKLLIADCCRDSPNRARGLRGRAFGSSLRVDNIPKNSAVMLACSEGEQAFEHDDWQHGAFTKAILISLKKNKRVTANWLSESVYLEVEALVKEKGEVQRVNSLLAGGLIDLKIQTSGSQQTSYISSTGGRMVLVPAGNFGMGSSESDFEANEDQKPQHNVTLSKAFYLGESEITQYQWTQVMETEPWKGRQFVYEGSDYPATYVTWHQAKEFCERLSSKENRVYRLPTEAEWEYSCRSGSRTSYSFGDTSTKIDAFAWFSDNANKALERYPHLVKQKLPNEFGLFDMHGNVWEWCNDRYGTYEESDSYDPLGPATGEYRVYRGGCWFLTSWYCRSASRFRDLPEFQNFNIGFRVASECEPED